ncbi:uncharacterized protein [Periplaneta americana]|uniref:uncharacterized protein isoform X2 n=1 Tax=Periplaneta americana TaxID=6978 RepID=UPI0037E74F3B
MFSKINNCRILTTQFKRKTMPKSPPFAAHSKKYTLQFSGIDLIEREVLNRKARKLGACCYSNDSEYESDVTHMIIDRFLMTGKVLAALASGIWILHKSFIDDSFRVGFWLSERKYEIGHQTWADEYGYSSDENYESEQKGDDREKRRKKIIAPSKCRETVLVKRQPMFHYWNVGLLLRDENETRRLQRILEAGGATVTVLNGPFCDPNEISFVLADEETEYKTLEEMGVPCISPIYIQKFLCEEPSPQMEDYCVGRIVGGKRFVFHSSRSINITLKSPGAEKYNPYKLQYLEEHHSTTDRVLGPNKKPFGKDETRYSKKSCNLGLRKNHTLPFKIPHGRIGRILHPSRTKPYMKPVFLPSNSLKKYPLMPANCEVQPIYSSPDVKYPRDSLPENVLCTAQEDNCHDNTHYFSKHRHLPSLDSENINYNLLPVRNQFDAQSSNINIKHVHDWDFSYKVKSLELIPKRSRYCDEKTVPRSCLVAETYPERSEERSTTIYENAGTGDTLKLSIDIKLQPHIGELCSETDEHDSKVISNIDMNDNNLVQKYTNNNYFSTLAKESTENKHSLVGMVRRTYGGFKREQEDDSPQQLKKIRYGTQRRRNIPVTFPRSSISKQKKIDDYFVKKNSVDQKSYGVTSERTEESVIVIDISSDDDNPSSNERSDVDESDITFKTEPSQNKESTININNGRSDKKKHILSTDASYTSGDENTRLKVYRGPYETSEESAIAILSTYKKFTGVTCERLEESIVVDSSSDDDCSSSCEIYEIGNCGIGDKTESLMREDTIFIKNKKRKEKEAILSIGASYTSGCESTCQKVYGDTYERSEEPVVVDSASDDYSSSSEICVIGRGGTRDKTKNEMREDTNFINDGRREKEKVISSTDASQTSEVSCTIKNETSFHTSESSKILYNGRISLANNEAENHRGRISREAVNKINNVSSLSMEDCVIILSDDEDCVDDPVLDGASSSDKCGNSKNDSEVVDLTLDCNFSEEVCEHTQNGTEEYSAEQLKRVTDSDSELELRRNDDSKIKCLDKSISLAEVCNEEPRNVSGSVELIESSEREENMSNLDYDSDSKVTSSSVEKQQFVPEKEYIDEKRAATYNCSQQLSHEEDVKYLNNKSDHGVPESPGNDLMGSDSELFGNESNVKEFTTNCQELLSDDKNICKGKEETSDYSDCKTSSLKMETNPIVTSVNMEKENESCEKPNIKARKVSSQKFITTYKVIMYKHHDGAAKRMGLKCSTPCSLNPYSCSNQHQKQNQCKPLEMYIARTHTILSLMRAEQWASALEYCSSCTSDKRYPNISIVLCLLNFIHTTHDACLLEPAVSTIKKIMWLHPPCAPYMKKFYRSVLTNTEEEYTPEISSNGIFMDVISKLYDMTSSTDEQSEPSDSVCVDKDECEDILNKPDFDGDYIEAFTEKNSFKTLSSNEKLDRLFLILDIIVELMEDDLSVFLVKNRFELRKKLIQPAFRPLVVSVLWRNSTDQAIGHLNPVCKRIIDIHKNCFSMGITYTKRRVIARLLNLIAEVAQASEPKQTAYPHIEDNCKNLALEIYHSLSDLQHEVLNEALSELRPSYLSLYVTNNMLSKTIGMETSPSLNTVLQLVTNGCRARDSSNEDVEKMTDFKPSDDFHDFQPSRTGKLKKKNDINKRDHKGQKNVDLRAKSENGVTPLIDAVQSDNVESCKLLLRYGGKSLLEDRTQEGLTALDVAKSAEIRNVLETTMLQYHPSLTRTHSEDASYNCSTLSPLSSTLLPIMFRSYLDTYQTLYMVNYLRYCIEHDDPVDDETYERKGKALLPFDYLKFRTDYNVLKSLRVAVRRKRATFPDNEMLKILSFLAEQF